MFQALYNSLSGLFSFSRSLNTVSNNVSNMNTPGFRGSDVFFSNINGGRGTTISGLGLRMNSGDIRQTESPTDLAIDGGGYFVLQDDNGNTYYTRSGQFRFDEDGMLVDPVTGYQVMAIDTAGNLTAIDLDNYRTLPPEPTSLVNLVGNLAPGTASQEINSIRVFDAAGNTHTLAVTLTDNTATTPGSYLVTVRDETGATVGTGEIRFGTNGTLLAGFSEFNLNLTYAGSTQTIRLNFGTPGAYNGVTALTGSPTSLSARVADGHAELGVTDLSFDESGTLQLTYSQSERRDGPQVALASFANESSLELTGGRLIVGSSAQQRVLGRAGEGSFGRIAGGSLEMSNIDLTQEFADMIIIQRGYQASSRVMSVSNEMLEQLYNSTRGG